MAFSTVYSRVDVSYGAAHFPDKTGIEDDPTGQVQLEHPDKAFRLIWRLSTFIPRLAYSLLRRALFGKNPVVTQLHVNVTRFYPLPAPIRRVEEILRGATVTETGLEATLSLPPTVPSLVEPQKFDNIDRILEFLASGGTSIFLERRPDGAPIPKPRLTETEDRERP